MSNELKRLNGFGNFDKFGGYYDAEDVDTLLSKKDVEIFNLKKELSYIKADSAFDRDKHKELLKSKDAEIRRLRRALWIVHVYKVKFKRWWLYLKLDREMDKIHPDTKILNQIREEVRNCEKSEHKCRAKAEEYK